ncbi:MAG: bifunctional 3,4-dihydroxy-2-butanone-4-phosphate synthase/GTP cyclohydrolase II [Brachybacterium sp.]|uniref:bifunctional 3,4-dihydroxy-2-butanone-4-phosphate synthase/GTP cyclohydrolase II n=1 Tax=Brachybacterium sp. TaxID=1891286 RepID=UPI0026497892|nr:bifunctional 3,4-dihydroxy-2-butanone-4-phosphate synthase/GTP cyclohydrolase II [Brachybacterium sp.]MDN5686558.1 bifunctional 3,4-dihydroxy-2-butanone-4-phosphate synthase/GTP cyclohydrolase II [Brachybacterium sp.]
MTALRLDPVTEAISAIAAGRPVVVVDDEDRENEGDLILAASAATPELLAFAVRYSSGLLCAPMTAERADALDLPLMVAENADPLRTAYTVSVDASEGVTTGISAVDRARTLRTLAGQQSTPSDLIRPGHVLPLRARDGGVLERRGHTEAAVDLTRLAGLSAVGMIVELVHDDGTMMRGPALRDFADEHDLLMISIEELVAHRRRHDPEPLDITAPVTLPTDHGTFGALAVRDGSAEHLVLVRGDVTTAEPVLTRIHSECVTGDVFGSRRCDCGPQLQESLARIDAAGRGVLILLRGHEGRGIGLVEKLRAYALQESGRDTVDANLDLGLPVDARSFAIVPRILDHLGIGSISLLTHNPVKTGALRAGGVEVTSAVQLDTHATAENLAYLTTKRDRLGHHLVGLPTTGPTAGTDPHPTSNPTTDSNGASS